MRLSAFVLAIPFLALLVSCGGGDKDKFGDSTKPDEAVSDPQEVNVVVAGSDWFVGENNFVFGITNAADEPQGGAKATAIFFDLRDSANPKEVFRADAIQSAPGVGPKTTHVHTGGQTHEHGGEDDGRVGYYVRTNFTYAGFWGVSVEATLADGTKGVVNIGFDVAAKPGTVAPGANAPRSDNLTKKDVTDIRTIDSGDPPNDMHDVKIKDAIAAGRPLVVVFSTPAFCTSRFCGPVNEEVEALRERYKDRIDFVHVEIWLNFEKRELNPTVKEWILRPDGGLSEPWVYLVDSKGVVFDRWEGPVAANIMESAVQAVAGGQTYRK